MFTVREIQYIKQLLRNVAEVDPNDETANRASQLCVELETPIKVTQLTEAERSLIQYAYRKRHVYVFNHDSKHAVNLEKDIA